MKIHSIDLFIILVLIPVVPCFIFLWYSAFSSAYTLEKGGLELTVAQWLPQFSDSPWIPSGDELSTFTRREAPSHLGSGAFHILSGFEYKQKRDDELSSVEN